MSAQALIRNKLLATERSLLIVEDDKAFLERLARAMEGAHRPSIRVLPAFF